MKTRIRIQKGVVCNELNIYIVITTTEFIPLLMTVITEGLIITWFTRCIVRAEFNIYIVIATDVFIPLLMTVITEGHIIKSQMSIIFLSMCDVKVFLTFTSPNMVLL